MGLIHWCTVAPEGPSNLAAIRFAAPIRVSSIRVFPNGAQPFAQSPEVVAKTAPEAFFLEVLFNAQPLHQSDSKEKQRVPNALVPTVIAYAGGQVDFVVDMGTEYATRLMIIKGKFELLSLAIYGDIVPAVSPPIQHYEARPLPSMELPLLPSAVDPSTSYDPTMLAKQLLALIPDPPPLPLVVRLMFCLKPSNEDWDLPEFPYLHADLNAEITDDIDLESTMSSVSKPVRDDTPYETLLMFAVRVSHCIGSKNSEQAYQIAKLLSVSASQHPDMARTLLQELDLASIFDAQILDEITVLHLLDAATNVDIARHFNDEAFLGMLREVQDSSRVDKPTQLAARRLSARIHGWQSFEDALSNEQGNFIESSNMLKAIGTEEQAIGIWLESMIIHEDLVAKLVENPVPPTSSSHPAFLLRDSLHIVSHDDFITFVRAYIGVASVLAVWAWTDSLGNDLCREQTLAVLHLWQGVDGYREIVNHLLLLRQLTRRLEWITSDNDPPRKSGVLAERVLVDLAKEPHAILRDDLVKTILSLSPPLSFIAENERLSMRKVALVAEDGLPAAVEELMFSSGHPLSLRRLRTLRVSLAIVGRELDDVKGEWRTLQAFWDEQSHGIVPRLVDLLVGISSDLNGHFVLAPPPRMNQHLADQLFRTADDLLRLIRLLVPAFPLTSRGLRNLSTAVADVFACADAANMLYSKTSSACMSAQGARQACLDLIHRLSCPELYAEPGRLGAKIILRTLLEHGTQSSGRDPAHHLLQVFAMVDHVLPEPNAVYDGDEPSYWVTAILPTVLDEIKSFFRLLDTGNKVHLVKRLVKLDDGVIGIGEWLLTEELKFLSMTLESLAGLAEEYRPVLQYQVSLSLHFIHDLIMPSSTSSPWSLASLSSTPELAHELKTCLMALVNGHYTSPCLRQLSWVLATSLGPVDADLKLTILLAGLRAAQMDFTLHRPFEVVLDVLKSLPSQALNQEALRLEIGRTLSAFAQNGFKPDAETFEGLLSLLEWLLEQENTKLTILCAITPAEFSEVCDSMQYALLQEKADILANIRSKITIDEDECFTPSPIELPESLQLSMQDIEDLFRHNTPAPATPKGTKTPDILGLVISPPTAVLRSPATTGLTKTYANNDFRQLRQVPSARQNTSRLPSMHVDDFEVNASPTLTPVPDSFSLLNIL